MCFQENIFPSLIFPFSLNKPCQGFSVSYVGFWTCEASFSPLSMPFVLLPTFTGSTSKTFVFYFTHLNILTVEQVLQEQRWEFESNCDEDQWLIVITHQVKVSQQEKLCPFHSRICSPREMQFCNKFEFWLTVWFSTVGSLWKTSRALSLLSHHF